ncbi:MAG: hypothetical protein ACI9I0_002304 [Rhodoferax sp.]|jgi:hypothetical protein
MQPRAMHVQTRQSIEDVHCIENTRFDDQLHRHQRNVALVCEVLVAGCDSLIGDNFYPVEVQTGAHALPRQFTRCQVAVTGHRHQTGA